MKKKTASVSYQSWEISSKLSLAWIYKCHCCFPDIFILPLVHTTEIFNWINYSNLRHWARQQCFISITGYATMLNMQLNSINSQRNAPHSQMDTHDYYWYKISGLSVLHHLVFVWYDTIEVSGCWFGFFFSNVVGCFEIFHVIRYCHSRYA